MLETFFLSMRGFQPSLRDAGSPMLFPTLKRRAICQSSLRDDLIGQFSHPLFTTPRSLGCDWKWVRGRRVFMEFAQSDALRSAYFSSHRAPRASPKPRSKPNKKTEERNLL